jgi:hypothetical protein
VTIFERTRIDEGTPVDQTKANASLSVSEVTVGTVTTKTIVKTIGAVSYRKTVAIDSSDNSVVASPWSVV